MNFGYLLSSRDAAEIYSNIKNAPIYDYHCHLSPKEIYMDEPFDDIGRMWLEHDHYKWRLMRSCGIDEALVTGSAPYKEKFIAYAKACEWAAGSPLYHWNKMELERYFNITEGLTYENAERIYNEANSYLNRTGLSPRALIEKSGVRLIATTDDITDSLEWHKKLKADVSFRTAVIPTFRTDKLLLALDNGYTEYINRLSQLSGIKIDCIASMKAAVRERLKYFIGCGCVIADCGIKYFPDRIADENEAGEIYKRLLNGEQVGLSEYSGFLGNMLVFLIGLYRENDIIMQLHTGVIRNINSGLYEKYGSDAGADCVGEAVSSADLARILDAADKNGGLPETILYTLDPASVARLVSAAGSFRNVRCGAAWWFCDHKRGIAETLRTIAECGNIGVFPGMLTDSRSLLSYARHDYYRRIMCSVLGQWTENGEYPMASALKLAEKLAGGNTLEMLKARLDRRGITLE